ncbi:MAG: MBL fold metallo-hydrolase [Candidatus Methanosuratincola petrocarbonis]
MVRLTFYGGVGEIGGNKILIEDRKTKIFLDFGQSFTFGSGFFVDYLQPRSLSVLKDLFEFDLLPKISGLYTEELLDGTEFEYKEPEIDAVLLSHAHFDHCQHICFVDPKIPILLGEGTKIFLECMETTSNSCDYGEHDYMTFRSRTAISIGDIEAEPIHVDHSIPGAYGSLVETSEGTIAYTGDLRAHGPRKDMTEEFVEKAAAAEPVALICEGTRMEEVERRQNYSEAQVRKKGAEVVAGTDKIVFVMRYSRDIDRFRTFYEIAKDSGRELVISPKNAYLLGRLIEDEHLDVPDPRTDGIIRVYYKRKRSGTYDDADYFKWEREYMDRMVTCEEIRKRQKEYLMELDFYQLTELIDIRPERGAHLIRSMSEPYSEEDISEEVLQNWVKHFGLEFHQMHASGHLSKEQLEWLVEMIAPKKIFPVHTENPQLFKKRWGNVEWGTLHAFPLI